MILRFFFFFQAEDGIRDVAVTGVQTCALPISPTHSWIRGLDIERRAGRDRRRRDAGRTPGRAPLAPAPQPQRSEEHTSELQSRLHLVCRLLLEKKKKTSTEALRLGL